MLGKYNSGVFGEFPVVNLLLNQKNQRNTSGDLRKLDRNLSNSLKSLKNFARFSVNFGSPSVNKSTSTRTIQYHNHIETLYNVSL